MKLHSRGFYNQGYYYNKKSLT